MSQSGSSRMISAKSAIDLSHLLLSVVAHVPAATIGLELDGLGKVGNSPNIFALVPINDATVVIGISIFRVEPDRLGEISNRLPIASNLRPTIGFGEH